MDRDCYEKMDQIFTVSQETRRHFLEFYPEYEKKVQVFHNILDTDRIAREAQLPGGFSDSYYRNSNLNCRKTGLSESI